MSPFSLQQYHHHDARKSIDSLSGPSPDGSGLSALVVCVAAKSGYFRYAYVTPSIHAILGYEPEEVIGKNHLSFCHPEEVPFVQPTFIKLLQGDTLTLVSCHRERHKKGFWVDICVQATVVHDHWVGIITRQPDRCALSELTRLDPTHEPIFAAKVMIVANLNLKRSGLSVSRWFMDPVLGPRLEQIYRFKATDQGSTKALRDEGFETMTERPLLSPPSERRKRRSDSDPECMASSPSTAASGSTSASPSQPSTDYSLNTPEAKRACLSGSKNGSPSASNSSPCPCTSIYRQSPPAIVQRPQRLRTALLINRFTQACTVEYVSNSLVVTAPHKLLDKPFFCIVRPSDRALVRTTIERAKEAGPVRQPAQRKRTTHGSCRFSVLKIPDFPPVDETLPQSTDENEKSMPGQEFIPVEAVFTAGSDGVLCVIERLRRVDEVLR